MAYELNDFLIDWFKAYHLSQMSEPVRKRLEDMRSGDDVAGEDYVVITSENQAKYREYMTKSAGDMVYLSPTSANLAEIRALTGNNSLNVGDGVNLVLQNSAMVAEYHRLFPVRDTAKVGEKIYLNDFRAGGQKTWFDGQGNLKTALPDISKLDTSEQKKFYRILRTALRGIDANPPKFADPDIPQPVSKFFGKDENIYAFSPATIGDEAKDALKEFALHVQRDATLKEKLKGPKYYQRFSDDYTIDQFLEDLIGGNYDAESKVREKAVTVLGVLSESVENAATYGGNVPKVISDALNVKYGKSGARDKKLGDNLAKLIGELDAAEEPIKDHQFRQFLNFQSYGEILKAMYDPKTANRQSGFFKQISENSGREIATPMSTVIENVNYDKVTPKYKDERSFWEGKKKSWDDWQDERIKKFWKRALRHNYLEQNAKGVVAAISKCEINPTDGLIKIMEKKADIKKIIDAKYSSSAKGFDFLMECLEDIEKSGDMKKAMAGALKNGKKAAAIAREIIKRAIAQGRMGDGKVALETLAVMRHDMFDSTRGKEVSKVLMGADFFKDASFMKNNAVKFVINAAQKAFNLGMTGAFWTGVTVRNLIQHYRGKIPDDQIEKLQKSMDKIAANSQKFKTAEEADDAWKKSAEKMNAELSAVKEWETIDPNTGNRISNRATVKDLLDMRERLYQLDDGQIENKMDGLKNRLAADDAAQKKRARAAELLLKLREKKSERKIKESEIAAFQGGQNARRASIDALRVRKTELEEELNLLKKIKVLENQVALARADWSAAAANSPDKKAAKKVLEDVLAQKKTLELNYQLAYGVRPLSARHQTVIDELTLTIDPQIDNFDAEEKNIADKQSVLDNFGVGKSEQDQSAFIFGDYTGDHDDKEEQRAHQEKKLESVSTEAVFDYFGFDGLESEVERLKQSAGPRMKNTERQFYEANMQLMNETKNSHGDKITKINELLADYDGYVMSERVCHEEYKRLSEAKARGLEKDVPVKEYGGASSEEDQVEEMTWFWNACNGFESGISVNDYNPFVKHVDRSQTAAFKKWVAEKRAGRP